MESIQVRESGTEKLLELEGARDFPGRWVMSKVGKDLGWGLGGGEMSLQASEDGIIESSVSLDKEFGRHPKSTEKSLESF